VPDASRITPPLADPPLRNPVTIVVDLDAGFPVGDVTSRHHEAVTESLDAKRHTVRLRDEEVPADRDFELTWKALPGTMPQSALYKEVRDGATYGLLTLFPPSGAVADPGRLPREVVFVIDTSGSMEGASIQQARKALLLAIGRLRTGDRFNVIQFNSYTSQLFPEARMASGENRSAALVYVRKLVASGGTEMEGALRAALGGPGDQEFVRQVVFLTDGAVGNEAQLFELIRQRLGTTRLFTVGIGSAPNGHFMTKAAKLGRGTFTYIGDLAEVEERMGRLFESLESPVLTDIEVRWPSAASVEAWPAKVPDLYAGEPVVVGARLTDLTGEVVITGRRGADSWQAALSLDSGETGAGMAALWARRKVEALLDSRSEGAPEEDVRTAVVALGLAHHLVTKYTSLVAVDVTPARPADAALYARAVPTLLPAGWSAQAMGQLPQTATDAPLHFALMALALGLAALLWLAGRHAGQARPS
jgi:Ca-activated chloride channel family protein